MAAICSKRLSKELRRCDVCSVLTPPLFLLLFTYSHLSTFVLIPREMRTETRKRGNVPDVRPNSGRDEGRGRQRNYPVDHCPSLINSTSVTTTPLLSSPPTTYAPICIDNSLTKTSTIHTPVQNLNNIDIFKKGSHPFNYPYVLTALFIVRIQEVCVVEGKSFVMYTTQALFKNHLNPVLFVRDICIRGRTGLKYSHPLSALSTPGQRC